MYPNQFKYSCRLYMDTTFCPLRAQKPPTVPTEDDIAIMWSSTRGLQGKQPRPNHFVPLVLSSSLSQHSLPHNVSTPTGNSRKSPRKRQISFPLHSPKKHCRKQIKQHNLFSLFLKDTQLPQPSVARISSSVRGRQPCNSQLQQSSTELCQVAVDEDHTMSTSTSQLEPCPDLRTKKGTDNVSDIAGSPEQGPGAKRTVTVNTVKRWIVDSDKLLNTSTWLKYDYRGVM